MASPRKRLRPSSDRILDAAAKEFARRGYGDTSLRQLMASARVSTTAFYARFSTKESVLRQLVLNLLMELDSRARAELLRAEGLEDGFERGVDVLLEVLIPKREVVRVALTEGAASPLVAETLRNLYSALAALLANNIRGMARRGVAHDTNAEAIAWSLVGSLNMQVIRWAVYTELSDDELGPALRSVARALLPLLGSKALQQASELEGQS